MGGGIMNMGSLEVDTSNFNNCSAFDKGGAIYTNGDAKVTSCSFTNNVAPYGGAIYTSGSFDLENNAFSGNTASMSGANLAGDAQLQGCGNNGLIGSVPCSAARSMSVIATLAMLVVATIVL
jgi:predicted outer membrane repeat protein